MSQPYSRASAEAAAWLARLQGDARTPAREAAFQDWLRADPAHQSAFERATDIWADLPGAALLLDEPPVRAASTAPTPIAEARARWRLPLHQLALAASLLIAVGIGSFLWLSRPSIYSTAIGEQKVATLEDGSRIALNTDSSVEVRYDPAQRLVELEHGEAMFEVAHNTARPFIVRAGDKQVRAVGTSFVVRREDKEVTVILLQGKVVVTDIRPAVKRIAPTYLTPGERLRAQPEGAVRVDAQPAEIATAWRRGQAMFSDTPLIDAVAELNRYGGPRLVVDDPRLATLRVSGVFATNDTGEFARAVAALHGLRIEQTGQTMHIVR
ncbi:transmembrane sensor [Sphingomonas kyeonggiensis]|uniref:Transmembrane sensor n=1 Tax=Sphingomonas kyeonggiensis TaxID=1268553 RepID=A0A7W7K464_9SPHN|nr:FecR family protein [Sphingomonas kyeonggiensis]MBB4840306.1 transmembrane sensor [Sphingomonas kyeonggiensis]